MKRFIFLAFVAIISGSCVSNSKFNTMRAEVMRLESELEVSKLRGDELSVRNDRLSQQLHAAIAETDQLKAKNAELQQQYNEMMSQGSADATRMLLQLQENQRELDARSARVEELEQLLKAREEALDAIRRKVADALLGFEGKGLTISTRDGKVYVSMDEKLLFKSGSFTIEPEGAEAVKELGTVLAQNTDINIMVEGHTDNVPYRGSGNLADNLDLSAKRATTVTRLLLENKDIDPGRITSAGRGSSLPIDTADTSEARARNRRTEIILSPKLDELMQLMDK